jgi:LacI family transcriptional regulator
MSGGAPLRVTMDEVARSAKVSRQTVSRVLHDNAYIAPGTRERVRKAIEKLGYVPDAVARSLAHKRTYLVAAVLTEFAGYSRARILMHAEEEARARGYNVFICGSLSSPKGEPLESPLLNSQKYEGVLILYRGSVDDRFALFKQIHRDVPVVTLGYAPKMPQVRRIVLDDRGGAYRAVKLLLSSGRRTIAQIAGPPGRFDTSGRMQGWREALADFGIQAEERLVRHAQWTPEAGYDQTCSLLNDYDGIDAIFAHSDLIAIGCLRALNEYGLKVPHDVAVVGFDNISIAALLTPSLTTVDQPFAEIGRTAMQCLIARIEGGDVGKMSRAISAELVIRESTTVS